MVSNTLQYDILLTSLEIFPLWARFAWLHVNRTDRGDRQCDVLDTFPVVARLLACSNFSINEHDTN